MTRKRLKKKRYKKAVRVAIILKHSIMKSQESAMMETFARDFDALYPPGRLKAEDDLAHEMHMRARVSMAPTTTNRR